MNSGKNELINGRYFTEQELDDVRATVRMFPQLSRWELAMTLCENLNWLTPAGHYKIATCQQFLDKLDKRGLIKLPAKREGMGSSRNRKPICFSELTAPAPLLEGSVGDYEPIKLEMVKSKEGFALWKEYVHRYHPLGYKHPYGASQRYFITTKTVRNGYLGCILYSASAWSLSARDEWIGWSQTDRSLRLNLIVNNSRFLLFPWIRIKNLASKALSLSSKRLSDDWQLRYGYKPVLLETFVDSEKYHGTIYRAANWLYLGQTVGRGRNDRYNKNRYSNKDIYVYPLADDFRNYLKGGER